MLWLRLLVYAVTGQAVWVNTGGGYWHGRITDVGPGWVGMLVDGCDMDEPYRIVLDLDLVQNVRERYIAAEISSLEAAYNRPDNPDKTPALRR